MQSILDTENQKLYNIPKGWKVNYSEPRSQDLLESMKNYFMENTGVLYDVSVGDTIKGHVVSVDQNKAIIDINYKEPGILLFKNEDPHYIEGIKPGMEIELLVKERNYDTSTRWGVVLSRTELARKTKFEEIYNSVGKKVAYHGKIISMIEKAGYWVDIDGVVCFMPGSLADINKVAEFSSIIGNDTIVKPISYSPEKGYIVVSHKDYLEEIIPKEVNELEIGEWYSGKVTGCSKHGVFVQFNTCLTGLIHNMELDETTLKDWQNRSINPGDSIDFRVKEIISNRKIVLTQDKNWEDNWEELASDYKYKQKVNAKINSFTQKGAVCELENGIEAFMKLSRKEIAAHRKGENVTAFISKINKRKRNIMLIKKIK